MRTHPVFLRLEGHRCVVVGSDPAAAVKALACLAAGAAVTVVAPTLPPELAGRVEHLAREYRPGDLRGAALAYASTPDSRLVTEAATERVWLNVIDVPDASSFLSPAVLERGELKIAIGTGGASPGLAAQLRRQLEAQLGPEYGPFVAILGAVRRRLDGDPARADVLAALVASPLLELVRAGRRTDIDRLLARTVGEGLSLERLGIEFATGG